MMRFDDPATAPVRHHGSDQPGTISGRANRSSRMSEHIFSVFSIPRCSCYRWKPAVPLGVLTVASSLVGSGVGPPSVGGEVWCEGFRHQVIDVGGGDLIVVEKTAEIEGSDQPIFDQVGIGTGRQRAFFDTGGEKILQ